MFPLIGTAEGWGENQLFVATGDRVACRCPQHVVFGSTRQYVQSSSRSTLSSSPAVSAPPSATSSNLTTPMRPVPVYAKSCLKENGCTDAGIEPESHRNFGYVSYWKASPAAQHPESEPVQHAQSAKRQKNPVTETTQQEDKRALSLGYVPAAAMGATSLAATAGITATAGTAGETLLTALEYLGGGLKTAGRWLAPHPGTLFVFGMFYSPKLNSGEQDFIDRMRLEQAAKTQGDAETRVRFRWEPDKYGVLTPKGYHVGAEGGLGKVPVRMLHKNAATENYEFYEDGADSPTLVWTPDNPGFTAPPHTGNQDDVYIPSNILVHPEDEIQGITSTETPTSDERTFRDYILVHPDGIFDPIYIYLNNDHKYHVSPKGHTPLPAFPDAKRAPRKTPIQGSSGQLRARWKDSEGRIYEWDSQHGTVEIYDRSGRRHIGEFDPITGKQTKPADPSRKVEK
ncbi:S-type pyocin domain-containing protein [Brenneria goodwinii]|nr:S-type pyocin domain-containing protein [Brenneria goodwinii]MCG8164808.1 S-type pyocin domain-containing protein [Brenneria goodwinii]MCG8180065.1 S-type pyocin domain-containing protein [Brenneria goodwinii]